MILVVGHEKGGVGKSGFAVNLAYRIAAGGGSVVVVDTDTTASSIGWYDRRTHFGTEPVIPVLQNTLNPAPAIVELSSAYNAVVCDVGARDYEKLAVLARIADLWIAPTQVGQSSLDSTIEMFEAFRGQDAKHKNGKVPLVVGLNLVPVGPSGDVEEQNAREYLVENCPAIHLLSSPVKYRKVWRDADRAGRSIYEMPKRDSAKAVDEFEGLIQEALTAVSTQTAASEKARTRKGASN